MVAVMNRRLRRGPPKQRLETTSGIRILPSRRPSGAKQWMPSPAEVKIVDAVLVTLMEHGITPSAIATRLTLMSAPESLQGAVAAGLPAWRTARVRIIDGLRAVA